MSDQKNYITPEGHARLKEEFEQLYKVERPKVVSDVAWAASNGDRSENGDYIYGKKRLRQIDSRLKFLMKRMDLAEIVDPSLQHGLNAGQQVMSFAAPNRIMVSRSYYDIVTPGNPDIPRMFSYFGVKADQDVREHEMYILGRAEHKAEIAWREIFEKVQLNLLPATWLRVAMLGVLFLMVLALFVFHDGKAPATVPVPDVAPEKAEMPSEPEGARTKRWRLDSADQPAGRDAVSCTDAERMLSKCD